MRLAGETRAGDRETYRAKRDGVRDGGNGATGLATGADLTRHVLHAVRERTSTTLPRRVPFSRLPLPACSAAQTTTVLLAGWLAGGGAGVHRRRSRRETDPVARAALREYADRHLRAEDGLPDRSGELTRDAPVLSCGRPVLLWTTLKTLDCCKEAARAASHTGQPLKVRRLGGPRVPRTRAGLSEAPWNDDVRQPATRKREAGQLTGHSHQHQSLPSHMYSEHRFEGELVIWRFSSLNRSLIAR